MDMFSYAIGLVTGAILFGWLGHSLGWSRRDLLASEERVDAYQNVRDRFLGRGAMDVEHLQ